MPPKRKRATDAQEEMTSTKKRAPSTRASKASMKKSKSENGAEPAPQAASSSKATRIVPNAKNPPPYSDERLLETFHHYADGDNPEFMSLEGMQRFFEDAGISVEGVIPFLLAFTCDAEEYAAMRKKEWMRLGKLQVDTPQGIKKAMDGLCHSLYSPDAPDPPIDAPPTPPYRKKGPVDTMGELELAENRQAFKSFYAFCFGLMKKPESRVLEMEIATATWSVVLQPKFPIIRHLLEFIQDHPNCKAVNKDLWTMTLEFGYALEEKDLQDWNDDESWPSMLDEFVAWEKKRRSEASQTRGEGDIEMA